MQLMMEALVQAIDKAGTAAGVPVPYALEHTPA
jgi:hypothetical protein